MNAAQCEEIGRRWVEEEGRRLPGFCGAFFHGSINWMEPEDPFPETSDLDIMVVVKDRRCIQERRKLLIDGIILEASFMALDDLKSPEEILRTHYLAGSFRCNRIIADETGWLAEITAFVSRHYYERVWVEARCRRVLEKARTAFAFDPHAGFAAAVNAWAFTAGAAAHLILVAGLENPTVRTRCLRTKALLQRFGMAATHEQLLDLLHCRRWTRSQTSDRFLQLNPFMERASALVDDSFAFRADMTEAGRRTAVEDGLRCCRQGLHREMVFWLYVSTVRTYQVLQQNGTAREAAQAEAFLWALLQDCGIDSLQDLRDSHGKAALGLGALWPDAQRLMDRHPDITRRNT